MDKITEVVSVTETPEKARNRYNETRTKEIDLLVTLADFYSAMLRKPVGPKAELEETYAKKSGKKIERDWSKELKSKGELLVNRLEQKFNLWQSFLDSRTGMNEGGNGEIFMRWVGLGLMEDEPEIFKIKDGEKSPRGYQIEKVCKEEGDRGVFNIIVGVDGSRDTFCRFRFNASFNNVMERLHSVDKEIKKMINAPDPFAV